MSELAKQFADAYREGAHGATMDADSAKAVALAIDELIKDRDEWRQAAGVEAGLRREAMSRLSDEGHTTGRTKAGNDISGL